MNPNSTSHKTGIIVGILIVLAIGAGAWYWFSFMKSMPADETDLNTVDQTTNTGTTPFRPLSTNNQPINTTGTIVTGTNNTSTQSQTTVGGSSTVKKVRKVADNPVAGAVATTTSKGIVIRYTDKATGHIYEIGADDNETHRITNLTIPKVMQALWHNNASHVIYRYEREEGAPVTDLSLEIQDIFKKPAPQTPAVRNTNTLAGIASSSNTGSNASSTNSSSSTTNTSQTAYLLNTKTTILGTNSFAVALAPQSKRVFMLQDKGNGRPVGVITNLSGLQPITVLDNGSSVWNVQWPEEGTMIFTTKPISLGTGFSYRMNTAPAATTDRSLVKIGEGGKGLTTLVNSSLSTSLIAFSEDQKIVTKFFDLKNTNTLSSGIKDASFATLPEKCVWGRKSPTILYCAVPERIITHNYPEAWYQGDISFTDILWKINSVTGSVEKVSDLYSETGNLIDAVQLGLDINDSVMILINKRDQTLWELKIK